MQVLNVKQKLEEVIEGLTESKLKTIVDFASYLKEKEDGEVFLKMQQSSNVYNDWISSENDIYDEVFKDEVK